MKWVYYGIGFVVLLLLVSKVEDWWLGKKMKVVERQSNTEDAIDSFIYDYLHGKFGDGFEGQFKERKEYLMKDWLDAHPEGTRMQFFDLFDKRWNLMIDSHVNSPDLS